MRVAEYVEDGEEGNFDADEEGADAAMEVGEGEVGVGVEDRAGGGVEDGDYGGDEGCSLKIRHLLETSRPKHNRPVLLRGCDLLCPPSQPATTRPYVYIEHHNRLP